MPSARTQVTGVPSQDHYNAGACSNNAVDGFCKYCNTSQKNNVNCKNSSSNCSGCQTCNTKCTDKQNYCDYGYQKIFRHPDVGPYTDICMAKDEFIFREWTSEWWTDYQSDLLTADKMGMTHKMSNNPSLTQTTPDPTNVPHPANSLVTADKYNELVDALALFHTSIPKVKGAAQVGCENADVIRASHALALKTGYNSATFDNTVCDRCNTSGNQVGGSCRCGSACGACYCTCSCSCGSGGRS